MEAIAAASAISTLVFNCGTAVHACNTLRGKWKNADQALRSISTEGSTLKASLLQLSHLMAQDPAALSSRWDATPLLPQTFQSAIESFERVLNDLQKELRKLNGASGRSTSTMLTGTLKLKYMWNEEAMKDILVQLRCHQQSLQFLLTILQMYVTSSKVCILDLTNMA
jgi:hypothetical protein